MIHSFSCKNFYSFKELTTIDFVVNDKAPKNDGYFLSATGDRLSKIETVVGPNASGKTNLLKVLPFLKWLINDSFNMDPMAMIPVKPFAFNNKKDKMTELSVDFEINGNIYIYDFILEEKRIILEELKIKNKTNKKLTNKTLFVRSWDKENKKYNFVDKNFKSPKGFKNSIRSNASIITIASRLGHKESIEIFNYWKNVETNVNEAGWIGDRLLPNATQQLGDALDFYSDIENKKIKEKAEELLSRFDLGLNSFDIKKEKKDNGFSVNVRVAHSFEDKTEYLPLQYESSGTKQLFVLLKTILIVLSNGGIAVLDEFDVNLHPEMVLSLFELFLDNDTNPHNAQLFFSTHSHRALSKLDKYQIIFTEKNDKGETETWRLDDMSGVRADENYYSKYVAGAYGAVPKL